MDFRSELYNRYLSTCNRIRDSRPDDDALLSYWAWCEYKYLPLLQGLKPDDPVLELGCGAGRMLEFLKRKGFSNAAGIDISEEQVQIATGRGLDASVADVLDYAPCVAENHYSAIIALDFLEHFTKEELMRLVPGIYRALQAGGILIIQTPNGAGLFSHQVIYGDLTHMTVLTPGSLQQILSLVGFGDFQFQETGPVSKGFKGKLRLVVWKLIKIIANTIRLIEAGKSQSVWTENIICFCRKPIA